MLRKGSDFSEESLKKSWGKESANESDLKFIPHFDDSEEFVNVFVRIRFGSTIKLVSLDESQVVTFNGKFVCGFKIGDCGTESQSDNTVDNPHGFVIYGIEVLKGNEKVAEVIYVKNWRIDNSRMLRRIVSLIERNSSISLTKSLIQSAFRFRLWFNKFRVGSTCMLPMENLFGSVFQKTVRHREYMKDDVDINMLTMEQYISLIPDDIKPGIVIPKIGDDVEFEINANFMRELRCKLFAGTDDEDAYEHVRTVLEIMDLFHFPGVTHDAIMVRVFLITLKGRALRWKNRLPAGTITTWDLLRKEFIWRYCHPFITAKKLEKIRNFKQERDETLYHAWERYNDLLYQCPLHDLNCQQKVHIFYIGLDISTHKILNSNGFIPLMTPTQALDQYKLWQTICMIVKAITTMGKENMKESVPLELPPMPFIGHLKEQIGDMDVSWDITNKDVERLRKFLTPTIHTVSNLEPVVQLYILLGPVQDMDKVVKEKKQDYDIPLNNNDPGARRHLSRTARLIIMCELGDKELAGRRR
ncbi:ribonuclease H-like domain-containing protein [Tanacetum coccineum]